MPQIEGLGLFNGKYTPTPHIVKHFHDEAQHADDRLRLDENVRSNENFYIGKQWEGVEANGLPTPVFNFIKPTVSLTIATITSDNVKVTSTAHKATPATERYVEPARILDEELERIAEQNHDIYLQRQYAQNAAIDGDAYTFTYWDAEAETGQQAKGLVKTEIIENTRMKFGDSSDDRVQEQPYIIITKRVMTRKLKLKAKANGIKEWHNIISDDEERQAVDGVKTSYNDKKTTEYLCMWKDDDTGHVWAYECTSTVTTKEPWDMGIRLYPVTRFAWDRVPDSYRGEALVSGLIHNQIFVNRSWAMTMVSSMRMAFPKVIYDKTRLKQWDNRVGAAIPIQGGDVNSVAKILDPAAISPQISQLIQLAVTMTQDLLGATAVALGKARPDNAAAVISLQRSAASIHDNQKNNLYMSWEDLHRIRVEYIAEYYGKRKVDIKPPDSIKEEMQAMGQKVPNTIPWDFDFSMFKDHAMTIKLDVGASSNFSQVATITYLMELLTANKITTKQFMERVPDEYIPARNAIIADCEEQERMAMAQTGMLPPQSAPQSVPMESEVNLSGLPKVPETRGYTAMTREIDKSNSTQGWV